MVEALIVNHPTGLRAQSFVGLVDATQPNIDECSYLSGPSKLPNNDLARVNAAMVKGTPLDMSMIDDKTLATINIRYDKFTSQSYSFMAYFHLFWLVV